MHTDLRGPVRCRRSTTARLAIALGGLVLSIAFAVPLTLLATDDPVPPGPTEESTAAATATIAAASDPTAATAASQPSARAMVPAEASSPKPPSRPDVPREHVLVRVLDATTGTPAPGVTVAASLDHDGRDPAAEQRRWRAIADPFDRLCASGQSAVTDAEGYAVLLGSDWMEVMAQHGDLFASANINLDSVGPDGFVLRLQALPGTVIRVLDQQQRPLPDVPLGVLIHHAQRGLGGTPQERSLGRTDHAGTLNARLGLHLRDHDVIDRIEVFVAAPGLTAARVRIEAKAPACELVMPAHGSVEITVVAAHGRPVADEPALHVRLAAIGNADQPAAEADGIVWELASSGTARFPYIGLGIELEAMARVDGPDPEARFAGPLHVGERVQHSLAMGSSTIAALSGRLVDERGQPWAETSLAAEWSEGRSRASSTRTDAQGRFELRVAIAPERAGEALRLRGGDDNGPLGHTPDLQVAPGSELECGDLVLTRGSPVARGTILEERPAPPGFSLHVEELHDEDWLRTNEYRVQREDATSFTIHRHAAAGAGRVRLCVHAPGCEPVDPIEFAPGAELAIVLRHGRPLHARIQGPPELLHAIENDDCYVYVEHECGALTYLYGREIDGEWLIESHGCRTGRHRLVIESGFVIATIEDLLLTPDTPPDPRLQPWDLRGAIQVLELETVDALGQHVDADADVLARDQQNQWQWCNWFELGHGTLVLPRRPVDLLVRFDHGGFALAPNALHSARVVVPTATRVTITFDGMPEFTAGAPIEIDLVGDPAAQSSLGLPRIELVRWVEWNPENQLLTAEVFAPLQAVVRILRHGAGDEPEVLVKLPCALSGADQRVTVLVPEAARKLLRPWVQPR